MALASWMMHGANAVIGRRHFGRTKPPPKQQ
jgi:hypothetical protein